MTMAVPVSWHIGSTPPARCWRSSAGRARRSGRCRGLGVVEDLAQLLQVARAQQVRDVALRSASSTRAS
jgi:hypothetical protein